MNYKYYVIVCSNGSLQLQQGQYSEWDDLDKAIVNYHQKCATLRNTADVYDGYVAIVYTANMGVVSADGTTFKEHITHPMPQKEE